MRCNIIGLGETGSLWDGNGFSIGVNDVMRFGKPVNALVCVNVFNSEPERQKIVKETVTTHGFYSSNTRFWTYRPDYIKMNMSMWLGTYKPGKLYWSHTSTFIAITLAAQLGYTEIVLYGCDLVTHKHVKGRTLDQEVKNTLELVRELEKCGIKVYIYKPLGAFKDKLPSLT